MFVPNIIVPITQDIEHKILENIYKSL